MEGQRTETVKGNNDCERKANVGREQDQDEMPVLRA
jgi:hypothetical protein